MRRQESKRTFLTIVVSALKTRFGPSHAGTLMFSESKILLSYNGNRANFCVKGH